jgi:hypothetical protein
LPVATYAAVAHAVRTYAGPAYTPHSMQKGAVQHLLRMGARLQDIPLLTLHRSLAGLLAYANAPDLQTRETVRHLSALLHAR